ncbi:hypothetical protein CALCODRAFT_495605 [Calocera cornea HHB12733]|uniref:Mitochondrial F1F0-ATP synthase g subunit n=1 Tax=Calocera cornea HHB12733 TaxID=1353952 RepID=A0A165GDQ8_9BASI|nr:hypothetical protein CALCODRAFT_495605 [Calocera cornea HHB12733]
MSLFRTAAMRAALRTPSRRFASSTTEAVKETASSAAGKTQSAAAAAQERAGQLFGSLGKFAGGVGDRIGSLLGSYREPLFYNLAVARELAKQVYVAEKLAPPLSSSQWTSAYSTLFSKAKDLNYWREVMRTGGWAKLGVYALEAYGIFKVGEMVGRRSIVGYTLNE